MDKSAATQLYRIVINASAQAIWDAITLPEWTEKDASQSGVCTVTMIHDVAGAPMVAGMVPGGSDPSKGGGGWPWVLSDLKSLLETGKRMPV
jgi:hypothetical protein